MKPKKKALFASILAAAVMVGAMPLGAAAADTPAPYVESDTTMNFMVEQGKTYTFKMTVHGTHANPNIVMGNGSAFQTREVRKVTENGNDVYYFKVLATGEEGQAAGIYTTLPGQASVKHAVAAIPYLASGGFDEKNAKTYEVGKDMPAGEYVLTPIAPTYYTYMEVDDAKGSALTSSLSQGQGARTYVTVYDGQSVILQDGAMVAVQNSVRALPNEKGQLGIGSSNSFDLTYKCGFDFAPGTYTIYHDSTPRGDGSVVNESRIAIYDSSDFTLNAQPVYAQTFTGSTQVTLKAGQYISLDRAYIQLT